MLRLCGDRDGAVIVKRVERWMSWVSGLKELMHPAAAISIQHIQTKT